MPTNLLTAWYIDEWRNSFDLAFMAARRSKEYIHLLKKSDLQSWYRADPDMKLL